jgi:hypothetical protein
VRGLAPPARARGPPPPRLAVGEEGEHSRMLLFDGLRQHDDLAVRCAAQVQTLASWR